MNRLLAASAGGGPRRRYSKLVPEPRALLAGADGVLDADTDTAREETASEIESGSARTESLIVWKSQRVGVCRIRGKKGSETMDANVDLGRSSRQLRLHRVVRLGRSPATEED